MPITWPASIVPSDMTQPRIANPGRDITGPNGVTQTIAPAAHLWEVTFTFPPLTVDQNRLAEAAAAAAQSDTVVVPLPLAAIANVSGMTGWVLQSAWSSGKTVDIDDGLLASTLTSAGAGLWLSILTSGRRYLYQTTGNATAVSGGDPFTRFTVSGLPRAAHAIGDPVNLHAPMIEGKCDWTPGSVGPDQLVMGASLTVRETR